MILNYSVSRETNLQNVSNNANSSKWFDVKLCSNLLHFGTHFDQFMIGGVEDNHLIDIHLTENPFLRVNIGQVTATGRADTFNITVMSAYTASCGVSLRPTLEDYSLVYFLGGEAVAVQDLMFVMDMTPYEQ